MPKILFSILITNYNKGKYIEKTINSCLKQKIKKFEILVYDDCSTDNSLNILKKFKNIKIIKNKKKKFKSGPLNQIDGIIRLFKISKGKIIFLLDGDDEFKNEKLKIISKLFEQNKDLNLIQDKAYYKKEEKLLKLKIKKNQSFIWPSFYPTSCISIRKKFISNLFESTITNNFTNIWLDLRIIIYSKYSRGFYEHKDRSN